MKRFENPEKGVTGGGIVCFASGGKVVGDLRLSIEKALGQDHAVFISAFLATTDAISVNSFTLLGDRLTELVQLHGLNLLLPS